MYSKHKNAGRFAPEKINKKFNLPLKIIHYKKNIVANWDKSTILFKKENNFESILQSFPTRERGLKYIHTPAYNTGIPSFPTRERGLK